MSLKRPGVAYTTQILLLSLLIGLAACSKSVKPSAKLFASPDEAGNALLAAAKSADRNAALAILGPDGKDLVDSGDAVEDKNLAQAFAAKYDVMHRWRKLADGNQVLLVGPDNFSFPVPLKPNGGGQWFFDTAAGKDEVLSRRIGRNELAIIEVCGALAEAQTAYFSQVHDGDNTKQYATRFISEPGKHNGLYWHGASDEFDSPINPLIAYARQNLPTDQVGEHVPFNGYMFRILTSQGPHSRGGAKNYIVDGKMSVGFAFVAYPVEYRSSGVKTFIVDKSGVIYERNLGLETTKLAQTMTTYDPDSTWNKVE